MKFREENNRENIFSEISINIYIYIWRFFITTKFKDILFTELSHVADGTSSEYWFSLQTYYFFFIDTPIAHIHCIEKAHR